MGARTDAARARVLAEREALAKELDQLNSSGREAVDIPARVRRDPLRTAGIAAGTVFVIAGGPQRVFRRIKRAVVGPEPPMPPSLLPEEVEKTLRKMGSDGDRVRGTLERDFARYLEAHEHERRMFEVRRLVPLALTLVARPAIARLVRRYTEQRIDEVTAQNGGNGS